MNQQFLKQYKYVCRIQADIEIFQIERETTEVKCCSTLMLRSITLQKKIENNIKKELNKMTYNLYN